MAYISKNQRGKWAAQINRNGERISRSFDTKREAQAWAVVQEAKADRLKSGQGHTFGEAVERYKTEVSVKKDGTKWEIRRLDALLEHFGADTLLAEIEAPQIAAWRDARAKEVSASTIVRDANLLRNLFTVSRLEWHWSTHKPFEGVKLPKENEARTAVWGWRDIRKVLRAPRTGKTAEVQRAFHLALRTGMRLAEVLQAPEHYDPATRVVTIKTKTEAQARIPIGRIAAKMLEGAKPFTVDANEASVLFSKLCREIGVKGLTYHDARASALTYLAKKVPVEVLAKISRHKDVSLLVRVYYRPSVSDIARMI